VAGGKRRLERVLGRRVHVFRPPYGSQDIPSYAVARACRMRVVGWTTAAEDWTDEDVGALVARGTVDLDTGGILLLHERYEQSDREPEPMPEFDRAALVDGVCTEIGRRGLRSVTVSELVRGRTPDRRLWFWP
jgi:peptidoglycan/xylan/chitin deacetylase (PgdA/CDA1 family)